jgi:hypothetical protein
LNKINDLKKAFFDLIDEAVPTFRELMIKQEEDFLSNEALALAHATLSLTRLFQHMLGIYMLYLLFIWPKEVPNTRIREKVYEIGFQAVKEIQVKLEEAYGIGRRMETEEGDIVADLFTMHSNELYSTIINLEYIGLGERAETLLDILWKLGLPFIPYALFRTHEWHDERIKSHRKRIDKMLQTAEDWRNLVKIHVDSLPRDSKKWARSVTDKY